VPALAVAADRQPDRTPSTSAAAFHWSQIRTNDYRQYLADLRALGCPEATARDIPIGMIQRKYRPRLAALRRGVTPYWQTYERRSRRQDQEATQRAAALRELQAERDRLIRDLLGVDPAEYLASWNDKPDRLADLVASVSEAARPQARELLQRYDQLERAVMDRAGGTLGLAEQAELQQLYRDKVQALSAVLSPQEVEQIELRESPLAHRLLGIELVGFSPTEREFQQIFRIRKAAEESAPPEAPTASGASMPELAAEATDALLQQALGESRFADLKRSQDFTYRRLVELSQQYGLPPETPPQVHDMRQNVLQQIDAIQGQPQMEDSQRQTLLAQIQAESAKALRAALGEDAYNGYLASPAGRWLNLIPTWTNGVVFRD
jgi:hypothetical protein